jgi:YHS domain-containing protein
MTVTISDATLHADLGGERFYFCSDGCRQAFIERNVTA